MGGISTSFDSLFNSNIDGVNVAENNFAKALDGPATSGVLNDFGDSTNSTIFSSSTSF